MFWGMQSPRQHISQHDDLMLLESPQSDVLVSPTMCTPASSNYR